MYYEDIDLSKRAAQLGMKSLLLNDWHWIHKHGGAAKLIPHNFIYTTIFLELGLLSLFLKVK
tara:strand:+ start:163 stop:348 length:186 start_codon:yes stop_codon:yes gene_type:complete